MTQFEFGIWITTWLQILCIGKKCFREVIICLIAYLYFIKIIWSGSEQLIVPQLDVQQESPSENISRRTNSFEETNSEADINEDYNSLF